MKNKNLFFNKFYVSFFGFFVSTVHGQEIDWKNIKVGETIQIFKLNYIVDQVKIYRGPYRKNDALSKILQDKESIITKINSISDEKNELLYKISFDEKIIKEQNHAVRLFTDEELNNAIKSRSIKNIELQIEMEKQKNDTDKIDSIRQEIKELSKKIDFDIQIISKSLNKTTIFNGNQLSDTKKQALQKKIELDLAEKKLVDIDKNIDAYKANEPTVDLKNCTTLKITKVSGDADGSNYIMETPNIDYYWSRGTKFLSISKYHDDNYSSCGEEGSLVSIKSSEAQLLPATKIGLTQGIFYLPFKYYNGENISGEGGINGKFGYYVGYTKFYPDKLYAFTPIAAIGFSGKINFDAAGSDGAIKNYQRNVLSYAFGFISGFKLGYVDVGVIHGKDLISAAPEGPGFNRRWTSILLGFNFKSGS